MTHHQHSSEATTGQYGQTAGGYEAGPPGQTRQGMGTQQGRQGAGMQHPAMQQSGMGAQSGTTGQQAAHHPAMQGQSGGMEQMGGQGMQGQQGLRLGDALTPEMRTALEAFADAEDVCEWCAEQCIASGDPHMAECIRLCRDVSDIAGVNQKFLARDSIFGQEVAGVFQRVARECAQECAQHPHAHCQECAQVLERAAQSTEALLRSLSGQTSQQSQQTGQTMQAGQTTQTGMGGGF